MISKFFLVIICLTCMVFCEFEENSSCSDVISRQQWHANDAQIEYQVVPVQYVIVIHTVTESCNTLRNCSRLVRGIQSYHMKKEKFRDIAYNFLVGNDGNVYEGVGWHKIGTHTDNYNNKSIGLAFMGNYNDQLPKQKALDAAQKLLECGVELGELDRRYRLLTHLQVSDTESPGRELNNVIQNWDNWVPQP